MTETQRYYDNVTVLSLKLVATSLSLKGLFLIVLQNKSTSADSAADFTVLTRHILSFN